MQPDEFTGGSSIQCPVCGQPGAEATDFGLGDRALGNQCYRCLSCGEQFLVSPDDALEDEPSDRRSGITISFLNFHRRSQSDPDPDSLKEASSGAIPTAKRHLWTVSIVTQRVATLRSLVPPAATHYLRVGLLVLLCIGLTTGFTNFIGGGFQTYYLPFFHTQAQAFLKGQTALDLPPGWGVDCIPFQGQYYLALPPLNAFLVLPFVALFGLEFPESIFSLILYSLNVIALSFFVEIFAKDKPPLQRSVLFCFLTLGTTLFSCSIAASSYFNGVLGSSFFLSVAWLVLYRARTLRQATIAILLLAIATTGRWHLGLLLPVFILRAWLTLTPRKWSSLLGVSWPLGLLIGFVLWWNWARFGNPFFLRYDQHIYGAFFAADIQKYGFRNIRYILPHLYHGVIGIPQLIPDFPFFKYDDRGNGFLALSPLFNFIFVQQPLDSWQRFAWLCMAIVAAPIFTHFSTGWVQFGYRYFMDFFPMTVFLLLRSPVNPVSRLPLSLIFISLWFHVFGVLKFMKP